MAVLSHRGDTHPEQDARISQRNTAGVYDIGVSLYDIWEM